MEYRPGDRVYCKVRGVALVPRASADFASVLEFEVVVGGTGQCVVFVPPYFNIDGRLVLTPGKLEEWGLPDQLQGACVYELEDGDVVRSRGNLQVTDGLACVQCEEFFPMAEPNQADGTLKCFACRQSPYR